MGELVVAALAMMLTSPVVSQAADRAPVKVFILAGQSNMEGYGGIQTLDELGAHPTASGLLRKIKKPDGSFVTRDDVFLYYHRELCGFVWFQGWNDFCADPKIRGKVYQEYPPVVVGELGVDGEKHANREMLAFRTAQAAIPSQAELKGTVRHVATAAFWYDKLDELPRKLEAEERRVREKVAANLREERKGNPEAQDAQRMELLVNAALEKARKEDEAYLRVQQEHDRAISHWECHYWGSARVYCLVGNGLAEAMNELLRKN